MKLLPSTEQIREFRQHLDRAPYTSAELTALLGRAAPPGSDTIEASLDATREVSAANALIRLFLLGATLEETAIGAALDSLLAELCFEMGLLERFDGCIAATVVIVPVDDLLFASDTFRRLGSDQAHGFVLPASTHAAGFLRRITFRDNVKTALDLGCGCGVHALLAARHCDRVVASDVSEAALTYTKFNAILNNISNVETRHGSLFEPVADERFDLIVSNPPLVIGPGGQYEYRDNDLELDQFCAALAAGAPRHLRKGGHLQMLCEWVAVNKQPWEQRLGGWLELNGCDAWILHTGSVPPEEYVRRRSSDISPTEAVSSPSDWLPYLVDRHVDAIHAGAIVLRQRDGANWFQTLSINGDVGEAASFAIKRCFDAQDFLELCPDDDTLLSATLRISPKIASEPRIAPGASRPEGVLLRRGDGLPVAADVDLAVMVFLQQFDGQRSLSEAIAAFTELTETQTKDVQSELIAAARLFVMQGFVEPV